MENGEGPILHSMFSRTALLAGLVLASSALAQEPVNIPPALSPRSFDLSNDSIKKAVRDSAATQYAIVRSHDSEPAKRDPIAAIDFSKPAKPAPVKTARVDHSAATPVVAAVSESILSGLIETLLDGVTDGQSEDWKSCKPEGATEATPQISVMCPVTKYEDGPTKP